MPKLHPILAFHARRRRPEKVAIDVVIVVVGVIAVWVWLLWMLRYA